MEEGTAAPAAAATEPASDGGSVGAPEASHENVERTTAGTDARTEGAASTGAKGTTQPAAKNEVNWQQRYSGLDGNFKQLQKQHAEMVEGRQALETRVKELEWAAAGLSREEIAEAKKALTYQHRLQAKEAAISERERRLAEHAALLEPIARERAAQNIAKEYGVDASDLEDCASSDEMERVAKKLAAKGRTTKLEERRSAGTDKAEAGGASGMNLDKMSAREMLRAGTRAANRR